MNKNQFVTRKSDHISHALNPASQTAHLCEFDDYELIHDSLPELDFSEIKIDSVFYISGMTAGFDGAAPINERLAKACAQKNWWLGLGSQRRELDSSFEDQNLASLHRSFPDLHLIANLGIAQLIEVDRLNRWSDLKSLIKRSGTKSFAVHFNPLQETIQEEGTPQFRGGLTALTHFQDQLSIPLILKETGSGMSIPFLERMKSLKPFAIDVSGTGGTHWARVEGMRAKSDLHQQLGQTFRDWGHTTAQSIRNARQVFQGTVTEIWASGGIRNGVDAAKCIALGATRVGFAKRALEASFLGDEALSDWMSLIEHELKIALFCTNSKSAVDLTEQKVKHTHESRTF